MTNQIRERSPSKKEREALLDDVSIHIGRVASKLVLVQNWRGLEPFKESLGIGGLLTAEEEADPNDKRYTKSQSSHLRKMLAVQLAHAVPLSARAAKKAQFMKEMNSLAGEEIEIAKGLPENPKEMPATWRTAYDDTFIGLPARLSKEDLGLE